MSDLLNDVAPCECLMGSICTHVGDDDRVVKPSAGVEVPASTTASSVKIEVEPFVNPPVLASCALVCPLHPRSRLEWWWICKHHKDDKELEQGWFHHCPIIGCPGFKHTHPHCAADPRRMSQKLLITPTVTPVVLFSRGAELPISDGILLPAGKATAVASGEPTPSSSQLRAEKSILG